MRVLTLVVLTLSTVSLAQDPTPPPLPGPDGTSTPPMVANPPIVADPSMVANPPMPNPPPIANAPLPSEPQPVPTYAQQCFGYPSGVYLMPLPRTSTSLYLSNGGGSSGSPSGSGTGSGSSGSSGSGGGSLGGGGDGKAILVLAVLVAVALPVVIYAVDDDAPRIVQQRFECPSFQLDVMGGVDTGVAFPGVRGVGQGRFTMGLGHFGADAQFDLAPNAVSTFNTHLLVRLSPKQHLEPSIAAGYRRQVVGSSVRQGFDIGLPHRYVFMRDDLRTFGLELRPSIMFGPSGIDPSLEGAVVVPLAEMLQLRLGGRVFSFGNAIVVGANAGLSLVL